MNLKTNIAFHSATAQLGTQTQLYLGSILVRFSIIEQELAQ